ncbi:hypothetical protein TanjilG_05214 [Lupinus angustifolius]|uniref:Uncharacterized protein n=1 Tax=Lupinus angustifolius TaxID=3871 RepID=A0A4P1RB39_LUPAN|nr:PREDICTED: uncharacterized protein At3g27210-like [Lupinus angustifolius]XP_019453107.1 PREDICTED: uncharacterized protein At3g27210-like [Lupinus angustifolius]OIW06443.1 hypothetical protein TanjilG_05214 [Lupinus angustifolius]
MGSCSSILKTTDTTTTTNMKLKFSSFGSKTEKLVIHPSPIKEKQTQNGNLGWQTPRSTTIHNGSNEEAFFDSKAWLDSDCEDDFYSVNGDFTPSRGNTPIHHTFGTPSRNKTPFENRSHGSMIVPSPEKKKNLLDLFRESIRDDRDVANGKKEAKPTIQDVLPKSAQSTPISGANSAWSSERITSEDRASMKEKSVKSAQWCIPVPGLSSCRSFSERRRKSSPAIAVNGKH